MYLMHGCPYTNQTFMLQCTKIINSNPVGDAVHGCPYKHWDESHLRSALQNMRCEFPGSKLRWVSCIFRLLIPTRIVTSSHFVDSVVAFIGADECLLTMLQWAQTLFMKWSTRSRGSITRWRAWKCSRLHIREALLMPCITPTSTSRLVYWLCFVLIVCLWKWRSTLVCFIDSEHWRMKLTCMYVYVCYHTLTHHCLVHPIMHYTIFT